MPRSVNHVASRARRKKILKLAKGFYGRGKNVWTVAKNKVEKGLQYAYRDRKVKKRDFRGLWIQRINAGTRANGMTYNRFIQGLGLAGVLVDRRILADLAVNEPATFASLVATAKAALPKDTSAPKAS